MYKGKRGTTDGIEITQPGNQKEILTTCICGSGNHQKVRYEET